MGAAETKTKQARGGANGKSMFKVGVGKCAGVTANESSPWTANRRPHAGVSLVRSEQATQLPQDE